MKKLVFSTLALALFSSFALAQVNTPSTGAGSKKVELKANKPASVPAATPATPAASVPDKKMEAPNIDKSKANVPKVEAPTVNPMGDLGALGKNIATELGTKLLLNKIQSTKVGQLISTFLTAKSAILPLMKSNPTAFASKLSGAQGDLMGGLKTVLSAQQMTNFMSLKPKSNDATNVLSSLFF